MGQVQFSEATSIPRKEIFFWQLALSRCKGHFIHPRRWQRAKKAAQIQDHVRMLDISTMESRLKEATPFGIAKHKKHIWLPVCLALKILRPNTTTESSKPKSNAV